MAVQLYHLNDSESVLVASTLFLSTQLLLPLALALLF
jgi:hypothetical protein